MDLRDPVSLCGSQVEGLAIFFPSVFLLLGLQAWTDPCPARIYENVFFYTHNKRTHISFLWNDIFLNVDAAPHESGSSSITFCSKQIRTVAEVLP